MKKLWRMVKKAVKKLRSIFTRRRVSNSLWTIASGAITSYVMWYLLPTWLAILIVSVVVVHEAAHYIYGRKKRMPINLPRFIPGIWFVMGWTYVDMDPEDHGEAEYYLIGPAVGVAYCLLIGLGCYLIGFMPGVYAASWQCLGQIYSAVLGSDGRNYQKVRKWNARSDAGSEEAVRTVAYA